MEHHDIAQLAAWLAATDLDSLTLEGPETRLSLQRGADKGDMEPSALPAEQATDSAATTAAAPLADSLLRAPCAGVLRTTHPLREAALVQQAQRVSPGQTLLLLEVGALLVPVCAPVAARVGPLQAEPGQLVGHGQPLMQLCPLGQGETPWTSI